MDKNAPGHLRNHQFTQKGHNETKKIQVKIKGGSSNSLSKQKEKKSRRGTLRKTRTASRNGAGWPVSTAAVQKKDRQGRRCCAHPEGLRRVKKENPTATSLTKSKKLQQRRKEEM